MFDAQRSRWTADSTPTLVWLWSEVTPLLCLVVSVILFLCGFVIFAWSTNQVRVFVSCGYWPLIVSTAFGDLCDRYGDHCHDHVWSRRRRVMVRS
jgi:hypothetical protein